MLKFDCHVDISTNEAELIEALMLQLPSNANLSINQIKTAIKKGALWLSTGKSTRRLRRIKQKLKVGDKLHFYYDQHVLNQKIQTPELILDKNDYSIWYKPYGVLCQGSKWSDHCTISRWIETQSKPQRPAFIVHRLDRAASGLIIIAHSKKSARAFSQLFEQHQLAKHYQIIVHGHFDQQQQVITTPIDEKDAISTFAANSYNQEQDITLVDVLIGTGRKHQIRKHAANINFPVVGDRLHNHNHPVNDNVDLQLCAVKLSFNCPLNNEQLTVNLPENLKPNLKMITDKLNAQ